MTDKEKRELKDGVISIFKRFNILDYTSTIGGLRDDILRYINSLQKEPVSEKLDEAAMQYGTDEFPSLCNGCKHVPIDAFKTGAKWQKKKIINKAVEWIEDNCTITFSETSTMPSEEGMKRCLVDIENFCKTLEEE